MQPDAAYLNQFFLASFLRKLSPALAERRGDRVSEKNVWSESPASSQVLHHLAPRRESWAEMLLHGVAGLLLSGVGDG